MGDQAGETATDSGAGGDVGGAAAEPAAPVTDPAVTEDGGAAPAVPAADDIPADPTAKPKAAKAKPAEPPPAAAKKEPNLTARLASLSRDNRETRAALKAAEDKATAAAQRVTDFEAVLALGKDDATIPALLERLGIPFEKVVNAYAGQPEQTAEQLRDAKLAALEKKLNDDAAARQAEADKAKVEADASREASARAEYVGMCGKAITANAGKYEICARLGDEAANDVFGLVIKAWGDAGKPQLMPGELEEAIEKAVEVQELKYEERGKQLAKQGAKPNGAAAATAKDSDLPPHLTGGKLSDKDDDILSGLIDKTAPATSSQRAKPRTINSSLGGSAPPRQPARGSMDPRDALREVLAPFQR